ncbi:hypothetical protein KAI87_11640 [Myxococcota bacterium]|nr:hypothetical protein [Myxococcota bacterium]
MNIRFTPFVSMIVFAFGCTSTEDVNTVPTPLDDDPTETSCPWDDDDSAASAQSLSLGTDAYEGYICPVSDQDWFSFAQPTGSDLIHISLALDAPLAPINPTYAIWNAASDTLLFSPKATESAEPSHPLNITHRLLSGTYALVVRDQGSEDSDARHAYALSVDSSTDLDTHEPNGESSTATPAATSSTTAITGLISFRGDEDWYSVESSANGLISIKVEMPAASLSPMVRVIGSDGVEISRRIKEGVQASPTLLDFNQSVVDAGTWYVVLSDASGDYSDHEVAYTIQITVADDPDQNEPNNTVDIATPLSAQSCGAAFSAWQSVTGYIGSTGDIDYYTLDLTGCSPGVLHVELDYPDTALSDTFQPALRIVRAVDDASCTMHQDCQELNTPCSSNLDCARLGNTCLASGVCGGSGICLPIGHCATTLVAKSSTTLSANVQIAAPIDALTRIYIAVEDKGADAFTHDASYTLRVRTIADADPFEPSEAFVAAPPTASNATYNQQFAHELIVHDCVTDANLDGIPDDCCGTSDTWDTSYLSYQWDEDWYFYAHPCLGEDCMVRVNYDYDPGPVDFYLRVYRSGNIWFDNLSSATEVASNAAITGAFGGLTDQDSCFYAYHQHGSNNGFNYYLGIRDTTYISQSEPDGGDWDWDPTQAYRICIEKIADTCVEPPCVIYDPGGCSAP